jgi:D-inositol-3-phosphate glycosyltransferase
MGKLYSSLEGFKYCFVPRPRFGAYVAMETFARGLLRYGTYDEYHTYFNDDFFSSLSSDQIFNSPCFSNRLKIKQLRKLLQPVVPRYHIAHFEGVAPDRELLFRKLIRHTNVPVTRTLYTIATTAHLRDILDICLLGFGGRPFDCTIVHSHPTREVLLAYYADLETSTEGKIKYQGRVDVIPPGIDLDTFVLGDKCKARYQYGIPSDAVVLISLARISSISKFNYTSLLKCYAQIINNTSQKMFLIIAGSDHNLESKRLRDLVDELKLQDKVKLIVNFSDAEKSAILSCGDIFLSLGDNLQESFGISLVEAMIMSLPVICTDWDGYKDIVTDGITGFRIPTRWKLNHDRTDILVNFNHPYDHSVIHRLSHLVEIDIDMLVQRILFLADNNETRSQMGDRARSDAMLRFNIKTTINTYEQLWEELNYLAARNRIEYKDLSDLLCYDYFRHFQGYPTKLV